MVRTVFFVIFRATRLPSFLLRTIPAHTFRHISHASPTSTSTSPPQALKRQRAQQRLCAIWHVMDILNALDEAGRPHLARSRRISPHLAASRPISPQALFDRLDRDKSGEVNFAEFWEVRSGHATFALA